MNDTLVWCVLEDGPLAGEVHEVHCNARELHIQLDGVIIYRRSGWCASPKGHRIARFKFTKTLVI